MRFHCIARSCQAIRTQALSQHPLDLALGLCYIGGTKAQLPASRPALRSAGRAGGNPTQARAVKIPDNHRHVGRNHPTGGEFRPFCVHVPGLDKINRIDRIFACLCWSCPSCKSCLKKRTEHPLGLVPLVGLHAPLCAQQKTRKPSPCCTAGDRSLASIRFRVPTVQYSVLVDTVPQVVAVVNGVLRLCASTRETPLLQNAPNRFPN